MLALPPSTHLSPLLLTSLARTLASDRSFVARVHDMFVLLREAVTFHDGRLICWLEPIELGGIHEEFTTPECWPIGWDDERAWQVARDAQPARVVVTHPTPIENCVGDCPTELTYFGAPVTWLGQTWGVLELRAAGADALTSPEQTFIGNVLPLLAAAIAVEGQGLEAPTQRPRPDELTSRQVSLIAELRREIEAPLALTDLLRLLLTWALESTGAEAGAISLVDHERQELVVQVYEGYPREPFSRDTYGEPRRRWSWDIGIAGKVARTGRALLLRDVSRDPDALLATPEIRAELAVPMLVDGRTIAVLVLDSPRSSAFGESEFAFVQTICYAAAQPLRRALWYQLALENSTQLGQVFTSIPDGLALLDGNGRVLRHNAAWLTVWGLDPLDVVLSFHVPWDLVPQLLSRLTDPLSLSDFCATGQSNPTEVQTMTVILRDPHQELQLLSTPTRDSLGQLTGRLWIVSDVTREREADRLKSEFISIVSHELRTPLTSILGYTELLLARDFSPREQREFVKTVYDQANHLSQIVEDLLGISRLEAGAVKLNQWIVSLRQLVSELTAQLNSYLSNRHRIVIHMPQRLPPAYVDRDKIKQIMVNLLTNAVKYSPRGGEVALTIDEVSELPHEHPEGRFLKISIRDQGIGIATEDIPRIWERFYRVDNSNTRRIGGTGLGLAITKALVELHGGRIWVESEPGKGSVFHFTVPVATEVVQVQQQNALI
jgi:signal transduction histidine kinase